MHSPSFPLLIILALLSIANEASGSQSILRSLDVAPVLHFTLARRGGKFAATEWIKDYVNMTYLTQELEKIEDRFNLTQRVAKGNRLVRKAKIDGAKESDTGALMGRIADDGLWFVSCFMFRVSCFFLDSAKWLPRGLTKVPGTQRSRLANHRRKSRWI